MSEEGRGGGNEGGGRVYTERGVMVEGGGGGNEGREGGYSDGGAMVEGAFG